MPLSTCPAEVSPAQLAVALSEQLREHQEVVINRRQQEAASQPEQFGRGFSPWDPSDHEQTLGAWGMLNRMSESTLQTLTEYDVMPIQG